MGCVTRLEPMEIIYVMLVYTWALVLGFIVYKGA